MKKLKRLKLKNCTTLNDAEMKEIVGGILPPTLRPKYCTIYGQACGGECEQPFGQKGTCMTDPVDQFCKCYTNPIQ